MKIFLTNDDGYFAPGIKTLAARLKQAGHEVVVIAPVEEQSGAGHSMTIHKMITFRKVDYPENIRAYAVNGTPTDCVKFGLIEICKGETFDLLLSGINNVLNLGTDIVYSGTFNAAMEGTIMGVPSIAVSTRSKDGDYDFPADFVVKNLEKFMVPELKESTLNINIPFNKEGLNKGVKVTVLGNVWYTDGYRLVTDSKSEDEREYILYGKPIADVPNCENCDFVQSRQGYITISPMLIHAADEGAMKSLESKNIEL